MAEIDDGLDYEGIAEDRSIRVGSDRCFRDYSPGDTVLSFSDDGEKAIYTGAVPSYEPLANDTGGVAAPETIPALPSPTSTGPELVPLSCHALAAAGSRRLSSGSNSSGGSSRTPLGRFRRDEQPYEKLALKLSADTNASHPSTPAASMEDFTFSSFTPTKGVPSFPLPGEGAILASPFRPAGDSAAAGTGKQAVMAVPLGEDEAGMGGDGSRPSRGPRPHRGGSDIPLPAAAPRLPRSVLGPPAAGAGSAATPTEELREMLRFMKSAEWEALASDDQAKYIHEVFLLRRRVRAIELPRESKTVRIRKRRRDHGAAKTDESESAV